MINVKKIGKIKPKHSKEIEGSIFGIGFEKLDRDLYDPKDLYVPLGETGVKYARIQSGWAKTEKEKGVYDFVWLDEIVDNLLANGIEPWMCLCYGNALYTEKAKETFCGAGCPPINSDEEMLGWTNYCKAVAKHYLGRVTKFEIWNEPDGDWLWINGQNATDYGNFALATAKALKEVDKNTYVISGATAFLNPEWIDEMLKTGLYKYTDAVSYHRYTAYLEDNVLKLVQPYRDILDKYGVKDLIQGESGCQSEKHGSGALWEGDWNEEKQTKMLLRRELIDMITKVKFCSFYTIVDNDEAHMYNRAKSYFGIFKNRVGENDKFTGEYTPKPSYYALQNICSVFSGAEVIDGNIEFVPEWCVNYFTDDEDGKDLIAAFIKAKNGAVGYCYYKPSFILTTTFEGAMSCKISGVSGKPRLVDLRDGAVYDFREEDVNFENGTYYFKHIPLKDYPMLITFGDFAEIVNE